MKPLLEINDRHPFFTGLFGSLGSMLAGAGSWYLDHIGAITAVAANVSAVGGAVLFLATIVLKLSGRFRKNARQRAQHRAQDLDAPWLD